VEKEFLGKAPKLSKCGGRLGKFVPWSCPGEADDEEKKFASLMKAKTLKHYFGRSYWICFAQKI
jgi:hypothetical protein